MTTYRNIHGRSIQSLATDPTESVAEGQIWYNTTSDTFKSIVSAAAWSSAASMSTARSGLAGGGTQTASWGVGGVTSFPATTTNNTEEYNGSGWATGGAIPTGKVYAGAAGPQTAGLIAGGGPPFSPSPGGAQTTSFSYNGTAWAAETATPVGLWTNAGFGSEPAFVSVGSEPSTTNYVFNYNGSSWTTGGTMNSIRSYVGACGTQTAGGAIAGHDGAAEDKFETYDGSSWTAAPTLNTARYTLAGAGSLTSALAAGGRTSPGPSNATELYDGSSWTNSSNMGTGTAFAAESSNAPNNTAAIVFAGSPIGDPSTILSTSEEFNQGTNVITAAAWASGGNLNTARYSLGGFGTATAAVAMCGRDTPIYQATEEYDGSSWTTVNNYPQTVNDLGSTGVLTAGLGLGGLDPPSIPSWPTTGVLTGEYDGTNWTTGGSYPYTAWGTECAGTQTATVAGGGHNYPMPPGNKNNSSEYDGSSWTAGNTMSQARAIFASSGSQTAALFTGGRSSPGVEDPTNKTEEYDGTNFSSGGNYITAIKENTQGGGPQTSAYMAGGTIPPATTNTAHYDGTAWATAPSLPTAKNLGNAASNTADNTTGSCFGGLGPSTTNATFDFTAETTAINVKTLTQS